MYFKQTQQKLSQPIHYLNSTTLWDGLKAKYILLLLESANDDLEDAATAFEREDYETAYKLFLPLAEQGDDLAQGNLEIMHGNSLN